jgi:2-polyprenyl-6-hydroxyphenyl methylase/3-demethylubiquinone-9 3-methyltransferase
MRSLEALAAAQSRADPARCKCCGAPAPRVGTVDFHKSCEENRGLFLPASGLAVAYHRCPDCGFLFTTFFDHWTVAELAAHVYNDGYAQVDPDYTGVRPNTFADTILEHFAAQAGRIRFLDWGAGAGILARRLQAAGFQRALAYDPFNPAHCEPQDQTFNFLGCFEVLEHLLEPQEAVNAMARLVDADGMVLMTTLLQGRDSQEAGLRWWYLAPRNGHASLYTRQALGLLWHRAGFQMHSLDGHLHVAWKRIPAFAAHLPRLFGLA